MGGPFSDCVFDGAKMIGAKANRVDFRGSSFRGANLRRIELGHCDLRGCDFTDAELTDATLIGSTIDSSTIFRGAKLIDVRLAQDWGPPERRCRLDLGIAQLDERTQIREVSAAGSRTFWHAWLSAVMHQLPRWKDKPWAPKLNEVVERKRQELKAHPPDPDAQWLDDLSTLMESFTPQERDEIEDAMQEASKDVL